MNEPDESTAATPPSTPEPEAPAPPVRPIAPGVQDLINASFRLHMTMGIIRTYFDSIIAEAVKEFPAYRQQIAEMLEGHAQQLLRDVHADRRRKKADGDV